MHCYLLLLVHRSDDLRSQIFTDAPGAGFLVGEWLRAGQRVNVRLPLLEKRNEKLGLCGLVAPELLPERPQQVCR